MARGKAGLTEQDLADLRIQLAEGKRPRVQLSGPHFPVETAGTVVRIGMPEVDGPDYVRVRVRVNNMTDELAFAPAELGLRGRGKAAGTRTAGAKAAGGKAADRPAPAGAAARVGAAAPGDSASPPAASRTAPARTTRTNSRKPAVATPSVATPSSAKPAVTKPSPTTQATGGAAAPGRRRKATPAAPVTVTIASAGPAWSLTATRGAKNLVRNVPLPPGVVTALAELLDQPALSGAIGEINDVALAEAQARAEQLRAELDQLEAVLATHRAPRGRPASRG
ncbi:MAG TPA: hypothetical protein VMB79_00530 [Jatrophihabitans sp.]|nr:hypothetical protein [Jatrophihabitans sp.]